MAPRRDFRKTKIVCTLGPSSSTPEQIEQLAAAGMNIARLNMSHGSHASHLEVIRVVQNLNKRLNHPIALLVDLQGPAIRTGDRLGDLSLEVGQEFHGTVGPTENPEERTIHVDYQDMVRQLKVGDRITVDNGLINLEVLEVLERDLRCRVLDGGVLGRASTSIFPACGSTCRRSPTRTPQTSVSRRSMTSTSLPCRSCAAPKQCATRGGSSPRPAGTPCGSSPRSRTRRASTISTRSSMWPTASWWLGAISALR